MIDCDNVGVISLKMKERSIMTLVVIKVRHSDFSKFSVNDIDSVLAHFPAHMSLGYLFIVCRMCSPTKEENNL